MDTVVLVREFEVACGSDLPATPVQPSVEKLKLRLSLELEELYEKAQAMGLEGAFQEMLYERLHQRSCLSAVHDSWDGYYHIETNFDPDGSYDPVALLDACCDQRYVQDGTVLTCGLQEAFYPAFANVQQSNLSNFPKTLSEGQDSINSYLAKGVDCELIHIGDSYIIKRKPDGKILKSINYTPANVEQFL